MKNIILATCLFMLHFSVNGQSLITQWQKCIGGTGSDKGVKIRATLDNGFIVFGNTTSINGDINGNHGSQDVVLTKLDSLGNIIWTKVYGGSNNENVSWGEITNDSGYIFCGNTNSINGDLSGIIPSNIDTTGSYPWVVKLDKAGQILWQKAMVYSYNKSNFTCIKKNMNGNYVVMGNISGDLCLYEIDVDGNILNSKINRYPRTINSVNLLGSGSLETGQFFQLSNSNYSFTLKKSYGWRNPGGTSYYNYYTSGLSYFDTSLNLLSDSAFFPYGEIFYINLEYSSWINDEANKLGIHELPNKNVILTGHNSFLFPLSNQYKIESHFQYNKYDILKKSILTSKYYTSTEDNIWWREKPTTLFTGSALKPNNNVLMAGITNGDSCLNCFTNPQPNFNNGGFDGWITEVDTAGNVLWQKCFGGDSTDEISDIITLPNNEAAIVGNTSSIIGNFITNHGNGDIWIAKLIKDTTPSINISTSTFPICFATTSTFKATTINIDTINSYQWKINGINFGNNIGSFATNNLHNKDTITCILNATINGVQKTLNSNKIIVTVLDTTQPKITITANANQFCKGQTVLFSSNVVNKSSNNTFSWYINDALFSSDSTFSFSNFKNNDTVSCKLNIYRNYCISNSSIFSNKIIVPVIDSIFPSIKISTSDTIVSKGKLVSITANSNNGGSNPNYFWYINNQIQPLNNSTHFSTNLLNNNDTVYCVMKNSEKCVLHDTVVSNKINFNVVNSNVAFIIYPNPASGNVKIETSDINELNISDITGKTVYVLKTNSSWTTINTSFFAKGVYLVKATNKNGVLKTEKLVIK